MYNPKDAVPEFLEYCKSMGIKPTERDEKIFVAGASWYFAKEHDLFDAEKEKNDE